MAINSVVKESYLEFEVNYITLEEIKKICYNIANNRTGLFTLEKNNLSLCHTVRKYTLPYLLQWKK